MTVDVGYGSPRGRHRRGAAVRQAILGAAVGVLAELGPARFTIPEVARRAGVHESSVYRKWRTREDLAVEALLGHLAVELPIPDSGSLRSDLTIFLGDLGAYLQTPLARAFMSMSLVAVEDPELDRARERFWRTRQENGSVMVERAQKRGEVRGDVDPLIAIETVLGPVHARVMLTRRPIDAAFTNGLIDVALAGLSPRD
ncbi:TetR/AcrR family transcriptional regulator [Nocardia nepalensis]|uniref:TetR/AcrR family transcriptional regulator n=1 Tax=Nocardia nepalensis TaxID=3375448 RepID=UPI003B684167